MFAISILATFCENYYNSIIYNYIVCEECQKIHHGDCPVHGPLTTLDSSSGNDEESCKYTSVPVPKELTVRESGIPKAGLGVFATQLIPSGVKFGPYKGQKVYYEDLNEDDDTSYMWEVYNCVLFWQC